MTLERKRELARDRQKRRRYRVRANAPPASKYVVGSALAWWVQAPRDGFTESAMLRVAGQAATPILLPDRSGV